MTDTLNKVHYIKLLKKNQPLKRKNSSLYSEAHERAQSRYDGYPWENKF